MPKVWFWISVTAAVLSGGAATLISVHDVTFSRAVAITVLAVAGLAVLLGAYLVDPRYESGTRSSGLLTFLKHALSEVWVVSVVVAAALLAAAVSYQNYGFRLDTLNSLGSDWLIAWKQLERSETIDAADVVLVGDSSCLMGIDAAQASAALDVRIESLCSLAWVGPAGYADMLAAYLDRHPGEIDVLMLMSTVGLNRDPSWKQFESLDNARNSSQPRMSGIEGGQLMLRYLFEPAFYRPLSDGYGQYFGSRHGFVGDIEDSHGTTTDPSNGLQFASLEAFLEARQSGGVDIVEPQPSEEFARAGGVFAEVVSSHPEVRLWFGIMPVASAPWEEPALTSWHRQAVVAAQMLGVPANRVLPLPATRPLGDFSTAYHLHRWGRQLYTEDFAEILSATVLKSGI